MNLLKSLTAVALCLCSSFVFSAQQAVELTPGLGETYDLKPNSPFKLNNSYSFDARGRCTVLSEKNENFVLVTLLSTKPVYINDVKLNQSESIVFNFQNNEEIKIEMTAKSKVQLVNQNDYTISARCELTL